MRRSRAVISDAQLLLTALKQDGFGVVWVDQSKWDADEDQVALLFSEFYDAWMAIALDMPGCFAIGDTQDEALEELEYAIAKWVSETTPEPARRQ